MNMEGGRSASRCLVPPIFVMQYKGTPNPRILNFLNIHILLDVWIVFIVANSPTPPSGGINNCDIWYDMDDELMKDETMRWENDGEDMKMKICKMNKIYFVHYFF